MPTRSKQAGDYKLSVDYKGLVELINLINQNLKIIGEKRVNEFNCEKYGKKTLRRSIYFANDLKKGTKIKKENLIFLRPLEIKGLKIENYSKIIGKKVKHNVTKHQLVQKKFKLVKNIKCVIEARMGSKRLPGKSMKLINDKFRLIDFVILNALNSKNLNKKNIFILTSENKNNLKLIKYLKKQYNLNIIIGSELNVFSRYKIFDDNRDYSILRLTGDNPLIDPLLIDVFINKFKRVKGRLPYYTRYVSFKKMED